jgi:hypothetical protein
LARSILKNPGGWVVSGRLARGHPLSHRWVWRNWCGSRRGFVLVASASRRRASVRSKPPPCRDRHARSALSAGGDRIPAHILPLDTPSPLSPALIQTTNAWLVSDGLTLVAVYAGNAGGHSSMGRFALVRQNLVLGTQRCDLVDLTGTGALTITRAPRGAAVETSAQRGDLRFRTASGVDGTLHLSGDTAQLASGPLVRRSGRC